MDDLELDQTLRAALSVTPSPAFVARVRAHIADAPPPSLMAGWLRPAAAAVCAVAVAIAAGLNLQPTQDAPATAGLKPNTTTNAPTLQAHAVVVPTFSPPHVPRYGGPAVALAEAGKPTRAHVSTVHEPHLPEVIISADDAKALREFLSGVRDLQFVASFDATPAPTPWVVTDLSVAPLGGDPLDPTAAHNN